MCLACGSYRHMMNDCQHSWEKMKSKTLLAKEAWGEESYIMENKRDVLVKEEDAILFTSNNKERISSLGSETLGRLLLDTGCTKNVCGQTW